MAKEYISRDEMIEQTKARIVLGAPKFNTGIAAAIEVATSIHAADVVEVVRCRECRYAPSGTDDGAEQGFGLEWPEDGPYHTNPCPLNIADGWYSHKPKPDFFCAWGKRKDGGPDDE